MFISNEHRFIFVSTPKNATHSVYDALERYNLGCRVGNYHNRDIPQSCLDYSIFTVVRNPYSRAVSTWWHLTRRRKYKNTWLPKIGGEGFGRFMTYITTNEPSGRGDVVAIPQFQWLADIPLTHFVHLENLGSELRALPFLPDDISVDHKFTAAEEEPGVVRFKAPEWRDRMTPANVELIRQWAGSDFELYGYDPNEI